MLLFVIFRLINLLICVNAIILENNQLLENGNIVKYEKEIWNFLDEINKNLEIFNSLSAQFTWDIAIGKKATNEISKAIELFKVKNEWRNKICSFSINVQYLTYKQKRMFYLLCRGPRYSSEFSTEYLNLMEQMSDIYNSEICIINKSSTPLEWLKWQNQSSHDYPQQGACFHGEPDLERLMKRNDLNPNQLQWIWYFWHNFVGPQIKVLYPTFVELQNKAAHANGYHNIGEAWKEELEINNLEQVVFNYYEEIKPLYVLLHAVIRHKLFMKYGRNVVNPRGSIPIHLLGNMWGQDWSSLLHLIHPEEIDLNERLQSKNWTVQDMVLQAEDMYASWGLPRMTKKFWKYSIFEGQSNLSTCHGTAANLYRDDDYRMLLCAKINMDDFYIIHHEMGHIQYYMAYQNQPAIFQDGANTAFHESIGDVAMHAVMTPQHLNRLNLLTDNDLIDKNIDMLLLFKQALSKIPEIPFALIIDKYRWDIFKNKILPDSYNKVYWMLNERIRGIKAPSRRSEVFFDAGAKFHIPDNTPYIRYFLSSIIQMDIFKSFCEITLYGETNKNEFTKNIPLHRCDIYGSKKVGKKLKKFMEMGSSEKWPYILEKLTGKDYIDVQPLLEYYQPIYNWLKKYIEENEIYVGW